MGTFVSKNYIPVASPFICAIIRSEYLYLRNKYDLMAVNRFVEY
jgi:hypothetical protein